MSNENILATNDLILRAQIGAHKEVINQLQEENLNARANFNLSQNDCKKLMDANHNLNIKLAELYKTIEDLNKQVEEFKSKYEAPEANEAADAA